MDNQSASQSNNSSTAQDPKETKDATEDGHQAPSTTLKPTESPLRQPTPTLPRIKPARPKEEPTRSQDTPVTQDAMVFPPKSTTPPSQSPLMPPTGAHTDQESSATAVQESTTPSSSSESSVETGRSRTHGELHGERQDSLDSILETLAVSAHMPVLFPTDHHHHLNITLHYFKSIFAECLNTLRIIKLSFRAKILIFANHYFRLPTPSTL